MFGFFVHKLNPKGAVSPCKTKHWTNLNSCIPRFQLERITHTHTNCGSSIGLSMVSKLVIIWHRVCFTPCATRCKTYVIHDGSLGFPSDRGWLAEDVAKYFKYLITANIKIVEMVFTPLSLGKHTSLRRPDPIQDVRTDFPCIFCNRGPSIWANTRTTGLKWTWRMQWSWNSSQWNWAKFGCGVARKFKVSSIAIGAISDNNEHANYDLPMNDGPTGRSHKFSLHSWAFLVRKPWSQCKGPPPEPAVCSCHISEPQSIVDLYAIYWHILAIFSQVLLDLCLKANIHSWDLHIIYTHRFAEY